MHITEHVHVLMLLLTRQRVHEMIWFYRWNDPYVCRLGNHEPPHYLQLPLHRLGTSPKRQYIAHDKVKKELKVLIKCRLRAIMRRDHMPIGRFAIRTNDRRKWSHIIQSLCCVFWYYRISSQSYNEAINYTTEPAIWVRPSGPEV
jgi:hypothetical protein